MIDLTPFCLLAANPYRKYLQNPFTQGEWTYASDGIIIVRVPRRGCVPEQEKPNVSNAYNEAGPMPAEWMPLRLSLPEPETRECPDCEGRGNEHECPDCVCPCESCDGSGVEIEDISVEIQGVIFDAKYIRLIQSLPDAKLAGIVPKEQPVWFSFAGGDGILMPMRRPHRRHIAESGS